jgi:hypothetical protein
VEKGKWERGIPGFKPSQKISLEISQNKQRKTALRTSTNSYNLSLIDPYQTHDASRNVARSQMRGNLVYPSVFVFVNHVAFQEPSVSPEKGKYINWN